MKLPVRAVPAWVRLPVSLLDVRLGARMLVKHPLMTIESVLCLAVGIPVGLAPMHAIDAFEAPLPVADGARVLDPPLPQPGDAERQSDVLLRLLGLEGVAHRLPCTGRGADGGVQPGPGHRGGSARRRRRGERLHLLILLVLAASGVYTMMAFSVSQRTSEIGIRSALGARPAQIVRVIGGRAAFQVGMGALIGMPLAGWAYFGIQQYTTSASSVFLVAVLPGVVAMTIVGLLACTAPLPRTLRISPREAMRVDG